MGATANFESITMSFVLFSITLFSGVIWSDSTPEPDFSMELIGPTTIIEKAKVYTSEGSTGASDSNSYTYEKENGSGGGGGGSGGNGLIVILLISIVILLVLICLFTFFMWRKQRTKVRSKTSDST